MTGNPMDLYEAAAFYRSAALCGETVTGHEYDEAFAYWDDTDFSNVNPDAHYDVDRSCHCLDCTGESPWAWEYVKPGHSAVVKMVAF